MSWLAAIVEDIDRHHAVVRVTLIRADGSTPRETGAAMFVAAAEVRDTIGGGALELAAIAHARSMLMRSVATLHATSVGVDSLSPPPSVYLGSPDWPREVRNFPLGPSLGQCCGGHACLLFEVFTVHHRAQLAALAEGRNADCVLLLRPLDAGMPLHVAADRKAHRPEWPLAVTRAVREMLSGARPSGPLLVRGAKGEPAWFIEPAARRVHRLYLYGAGHVGRAIVRVLDGLPFAVTWVDTSPSRFPGHVPARATPAVAPDPTAFAGTAEAAAFHIVLTYSHALDLAICHSLLRRGDFRFLGLIGSATKRVRFLKRLSDLGIGPALLARLVCPIGMPGLGGKEPAVIALSVAAQLVQLASVSDAAAAMQTPRREDAGR